jgi:hypothetical protein
MKKAAYLTGICFFIISGINGVLAQDTVQCQKQVPELIKVLNLDESNMMSDQEKKEATGSFDLYNIPDYLQLESGLYGLYDIELIYKRMGGSGNHFIRYSVRELIGPEFPVNGR